MTAQAEQNIVTPLPEPPGNSKPALRVIVGAKQQWPKAMRPFTGGLRYFNEFPAFVRALLLIVGLPTMAATTYFGFVASDIYISETRFSIRSSERAPANDFLSAVLSPAGISGSSEDTAIVADYIRSMDMLQQLQERLDIWSHYTSSKADWLSRLSTDAYEEDFLDYYRHMVKVSKESTSDITILRVRAFDPDTAQNIAVNIMELSELLINQWSERITEDTLRFARSELSKAEENVRASGAALTRFRNASRSIDPSQETSAVLSIITGLESQLAEAKTQLMETSSFMKKDSAQVRQLQAKVTALERQVYNERKRLAGESGTELTRLIDGYEPLLLDQQLAQQRYTSALTSLEIARAEAQRKQRYLIAFVQPQLPDDALEPHRFWNILTTLIGSLLIFAIGSLVWAAVNDHLGR